MRALEMVRAVSLRDSGCETKGSHSDTSCVNVIHAVGELCDLQTDK